MHSAKSVKAKIRDLQKENIDENYKRQKKLQDEQEKVREQKKRENK